MVQASCVGICCIFAFQTKNAESLNEKTEFINPLTKQEQHSWEKKQLHVCTWLQIELINSVNMTFNLSEAGKNARD